VIGNKCELYIETFEGYKQKGLGTHVALACVQECIAKGFVVHWHCFKYNYGAVKIAETLGLVKTVECPVYVFDIQDKQES